MYQNTLQSCGVECEKFRIKELPRKERDNIFCNGEIIP